MMKKALLATTLLVATAGMAAADVTLSGYGRFGLVYGDDGVTSDTRIHTRLRINLDASMETDSGLKFGGRIRMQHTDGDASGGANLSPALLYMETSGFRVEVGNVNTAYDSAGLYYNSEIGFTDSSFGESQSFAFYSFSSGPYGATEVDRMGLFASYSVGDFTGRISIVDPSQDNALNAAEKEISVSFDYSSGPFSVSLAAAQDAAGILDNDLFFIGAAYAIGDSTNVGLNYYDENVIAGGVVAGSEQTITLYGNHTLANGLTLAGYISDTDTLSDMAIGLGASYSLGEGARLSGAYHKRGDVAFADLGIRFDF
jgi:outer membrane protein OmpU